MIESDRSKQFHRTHRNCVLCKKREEKFFFSSSLFFDLVDNLVKLWGCLFIHIRINVYLYIDANDDDVNISDMDCFDTIYNNDVTITLYLR